MEMGAEVTGELYGNVLAGAGDVSGGVKGDAKAELMLCSKEPSTQAQIKLIGLALTAQFSAAWGLYSTSWSGPILKERFPLAVWHYP
jgi:hypothetical protein